MSGQEMRCFSCGRRVGAAERRCPSCAAGLLVDVIVDAVPDDPRTVFHAARALAELGDPVPEPAEARRLLQSPPAVLAGGCTRLRAEEVRACLAAHGLRSRLVPSRVLAKPVRPGAPQGPLSPVKRVVAMVRARPAVAVAGALAVAALLVAVLVLLGGGEPRQSRPAEPLPGRELARRLTRASVRIRCGDAGGTGFFVKEDLLVTTGRLIPGSDPSVEVLLRDGRVLRGRRERSDEWFDLAVVRVPGAAREPLELGDATALQLGDPVLVTGAPVGLEVAVAQGLVSHPARSIMGSCFVQVDSGAAGAGEGGAVLDQYGRVVGVVSATPAGAAGITLAVPVNALFSGAEPLLERHRDTGEQQRWNRMVLDADRQGREELERLLADPQGPALVAADLVADLAAEVVAVRLPGPSPEPQRLGFTLEVDGVPPCELTAPVGGWDPVPPPGEVVSRSPYLRWLERHHALDRVHTTSVSLDLGACPGSQQLEGATLYLAGADRHAASTPLRQR